MSVMSSRLPRKRKFAMAQAAAIPNSAFTGTTMAAVSSVRPMAERASGCKIAWRYRPRPALSAVANTAASGTATNEPRRTAAAETSSQRTGAGSVTPGCRICGAIRIDSPNGIRLPRRRPQAPDAPALEHVGCEQERERGEEQDERQRGGAGVVVLLEPGDDEEWRDLGAQRQVARDEHDRAVLAERPRDRQREPGEHRGKDGGEDDPPERLQPAGAQHGSRFLEMRLDPGEHRLHRADDERQTDEGHRQPDPDGRVGHLDPE